MCGTFVAFTALREACIESVCGRPYGTTERLREHLQGAAARNISVRRGYDPWVQRVSTVIHLLIRRLHLVGTACQVGIFFSDLSL